MYTSLFLQTILMHIYLKNKDYVFYKSLSYETFYNTYSSLFKDRFMRLFEKNKLFICMILSFLVLKLQNLRHCVF